MTGITETLTIGKQTRGIFKYGAPVTERSPNTIFVSIDPRGKKIVQCRVNRTDYLGTGRHKKHSPEGQKVQERAKPVFGSTQLEVSCDESPNS